jgi:hypothetical protein
MVDLDSGDSPALKGLTQREVLRRRCRGLYDRDLAARIQNNADQCKLGRHALLYPFHRLRGVEGSTIRDKERVFVDLGELREGRREEWGRRWRRKDEPARGRLRNIVLSDWCQNLIGKDSAKQEYKPGHRYEEGREGIAHRQPFHR